MRKYMYTLLFIFPLCVACKDGDVEGGSAELREAFARQTAVGVWQGGSALLLYQSDLHQTATTDDGLSWRIQTDDQSAYFSCRLDEAPAVDRPAKAVIRTKGIQGIADGNQTATLLKEEGAKRWLWLAEARTGLIIQGTESLTNH